MIKVKIPMLKNMKWIAFGLLSAAALTGCQSNQPFTPPASPQAAAVDFKPNVDAGVPPATSAASIMTLAANKRFGNRPDPFSLLGLEKAWEEKMSAERLASEGGFFAPQYEPKEDEVVVEPEEPQPYRRLAGVLVGETVSAIIIMEDGRAELIRPGMMIPNSEWRVVSIDEEKAVLRRATKRPRTIVVRLEVDPRGSGGGFSGGGGGNQGGGGGEGNRGPENEGGRGGSRGGGGAGTMDDR
jgi:hypothetical protein